MNGKIYMRIWGKLLIFVCLMIGALPVALQTPTETPSPVVPHNMEERNANLATLENIGVTTRMTVEADNRVRATEVYIRQLTPLPTLSEEGSFQATPPPTVQPSPTAEIRVDALFEDLKSGPAANPNAGRDSIILIGIVIVFLVGLTIVIRNEMRKD